MASLIAHILLISPLLRQQAYFAVASERAEQAGTGYGLVILGWGVVTLLGLLYTLSPRLRKMLPRYFWNHRFYQEAIRRGREVIPVETTTVLLAISGAIGLLMAVWLNLVQMSDAFTAVVQSLPPVAQTLVAQLVHRAWVTVILAGATAGLVIMLWAGWLVLISTRLGRPIRYEQAFMLTIWPHWIMFIPAGLAWITAGTAGIPPEVLLFSWFVAAGYATVRVWMDFRVVARVGTPYILALAVGSPLCLLTIVIIILAAGQNMDVSSFWDLVWSP